MNPPTTLRLFALVCLSSLTAACDSYDPFHADTANLEGVWAIDNTISRKASEPPVRKELSVYATHMEYRPGNGTYGAQGQWRDGGFWCAAKDGSGEIEAVKVLSPETVELRVAAFKKGSAEVLTLYKTKPGDTERAQTKQAMAAKYPGPFSYPPPQGTITPGMTEYQLTQLPWKADKIIGMDELSIHNLVPPEDGDSKDDDATIYCYHSDDPHLVELRVTVKNHKVVTVSGGNG